MWFWQLHWSSLREEPLGSDEDVEVVGISCLDGMKQYQLIPTEETLKISGRESIGAYFQKIPILSLFCFSEVGISKQKEMEIRDRLPNRLCSQTFASDT